MKTKTIVILSIVGLAIILLVANKLNNNRKAKLEIERAVAQNKIENLESNVTTLENQNLGYKSTQYTLLHLNNILNAEIYHTRQKYQQIALKYVKLKDNVKALPADSVASLFLSRAGNNDTVKKYEDKYIIPEIPRVCVGFTVQNIRFIGTRCWHAAYIHSVKIQVVIIAGCSSFVNTIYCCWSISSKTYHIIGICHSSISDINPVYSGGSTACTNR